MPGAISGILLVAAFASAAALCAFLSVRLVGISSAERRS
jgi:hypothetical protein